MLALIVSFCPSITNGVARMASSSLETFAASSAERIGDSTTVNSSPPIRARVSEVRTRERSRVATSRSNLSPTVPLGNYVLETACRAALGWQSQCPDDVGVAVDVSSVQFERSNIVQAVREILGRTHLPPHLLQIELTESVMLSGADGARRIMDQLHRLGVGLAIDDFGTGYSSLSYLPSLPFDALKIDRSFVRELDSRPQTRAMIHTLVALAREIGIRVIVEGVETPQQFRILQELGAEEVQGFLLGKPTADPIECIRAIARHAEGSVGKIPEMLESAEGCANA